VTLSKLQTGASWVVKSKPGNLCGLGYVSVFWAVKLNLTNFFVLQWLSTDSSTTGRRRGLPPRLLYTLRRGRGNELSRPFISIGLRYTRTRQAYTYGVNPVLARRVVLSDQSIASTRCTQPDPRSRFRRPPLVSRIRRGDKRCLPRGSRPPFH
jgi:hypothetical protein